MTASPKIIPSFPAVEQKMVRQTAFDEVEYISFTWRNLLYHAIMFFTMLAYGQTHIENVPHAHKPANTNGKF